MHRTTAAMLNRQTSSLPSETLADRFASVRSTTTRLTDPISPEEACVQSMADCSPTKWHMAHTTWFFERLVLCEFEENYRPHDERYHFLFNSYYNSLGARHPRHLRGVITRPALDEVRAYRANIDERILALLEHPTLRDRAEAERLIILGLQHEQQHQELMLSDLKHLLWCSPLKPAYADYLPDDHRTDLTPRPFDTTAPPLEWLGFEGRETHIGVDTDAPHFRYDNETPRHRHLLAPYEIASRPVTNREYAAFIEDGGYTHPEHWLDDGWIWLQREHAEHPLYWSRDADTPLGYREFTLYGERPLQPDAPVLHLSYYEADAFARWRHARLPTEHEWEHAATLIGERGRFVEDHVLHTEPIVPALAGRMTLALGTAWEWTSSAYAAYPGYRAEAGALGEYNAKFMCNQFVLRGGSLATPQSHLRTTYRNFFHPDKRWAFSTLRLAKDA